MKKDVDAVITSWWSVQCAAMQYNVPKSTLDHRVSRWVQVGAMSGPTKYLTPLEENELSRFLSCCCQIGYAHSKLEVLALVQQTLDSKGMKITLVGLIQEKTFRVVLHVPASPCISSTE